MASVAKEALSGKTTWAASKSLHCNAAEELGKAAGSYRKVLRQVKQQLTDLELLGRDIAKGIVEAGKVGVDCLDQDEMFLIVPTIGKQIKFHRNRCMEQENTDFEFLESLQEMANEKVEVLQAAYEERPGEVVHHLVVSEDEVRRLQKSVLDSHQECQECYMEGEEALSEQLFELTQYANIFKRLLKKAQALTDEHRAKLMSELLESENEEKKRAQAKAHKKRSKQQKNKARSNASMAKAAVGDPQQEEEPPEEDDLAWASEYASAGPWQHLLHHDESGGVAQPNANPSETAKSEVSQDGSKGTSAECSTVDITDANLDANGTANSETAAGGASDEHAEAEAYAEACSSDSGSVSQAQPDAQELLSQPPMGEREVSSQPAAAMTDYHVDRILGRETDNNGHSTPPRILPADRAPSPKPLSEQREATLPAAAAAEKAEAYGLPRVDIDASSQSAASEIVTRSSRPQPKGLQNCNLDDLLPLLLPQPLPKSPPQGVTSALPSVTAQPTASKELSAAAMDSHSMAPTEAKVLGTVEVSAGSPRPNAKWLQASETGTRPSGPVKPGPAALPQHLHTPAAKTGLQQEGGPAGISRPSLPPTQWAAQARHVQTPPGAASAAATRQPHIAVLTPALTPTQARNLSAAPPHPPLPPPAEQEAFARPLPAQQLPRQQGLSAPRQPSAPGIGIRESKAGAHAADRSQPKPPQQRVEPPTSANHTLLTPAAAARSTDEPQKGSILPAGAVGASRQPEHSQDVRQDVAARPASKIQSIVEQAIDRRDAAQELAQIEPQTVQVKLTAAGAAAAARQRAVVGQRPMQSARSSPSQAERPLQQQQPAWVPLQRGATTLKTMVAGSVTPRSSSQQNLAETAVHAGCPGLPMAEGPATNALLAKADRAKVERASAQIMHALGLTPSGKPAASKAAPLKASKAPSIQQMSPVRQAPKPAVLNLPQTAARPPADRLMGPRTPAQGAPVIQQLAPKSAVPVSISQHPETPRVVSPPTPPLRFGSLSPMPLAPTSTIQLAGDSAATFTSATSEEEAVGDSEETATASTAAATAHVPESVGQLLSILFGISSVPAAANSGHPEAPSSVSAAGSEGAWHGSAGTDQPAEEQQMQRCKARNGVSQSAPMSRQQQKQALLNMLRTGGKKPVDVRSATSELGREASGWARGKQQESAASSNAVPVFGPVAKRVLAAMGGSDLAAAMLRPLCCPITKDLMQDPVIAADGITYERAAIAKWLVQRKVSYVTHVFMRPELLPNRNVHAIIERIHTP